MLIIFVSYEFTLKLSFLRNKWLENVRNKDNLFHPLSFSNNSSENFFLLEVWYSSFYIIFIFSSHLKDWSLDLVMNNSEQVEDYQKNYISYKLLESKGDIDIQWYFCFNVNKQVNQIDQLSSNWVSKNFH